MIFSTMDVAEKDESSSFSSSSANVWPVTSPVNQDGNYLTASSRATVLYFILVTFERLLGAAAALAERPAAFWKVDTMFCWKITILKTNLSNLKKIVCDGKDDHT